MKRRTFLKSLGALASLPGLPGVLPALAKTRLPAVPADTLRWAEVIVRAHKTSSVAMLQRNLGIGAEMAQAVHARLVSGGVIAAQANAWGMHEAVNPLFDGLMRQSNISALQVRRWTKRFRLAETPDRSPHAEPVHEVVDHTPDDLAPTANHDENPSVEPQPEEIAAS